MIKPCLLFPVTSPKKWAAIRSVLTAAPVALLGYLRHKFDVEPEAHKELAKFFASHWAITSLIASPIIISLFSDLYQWLAEYIQSQSKNYQPHSHVITTLAALNKVVGRKLDRFGIAAKEVKRRQYDAAEAFLEITKPEMQIEELVEQLCALLRTLSENPGLKLVLVEFGGKPPNAVAFAGYSPKTSRPKDELLTSKESFFHYVAKTQSFQAIDDIESYVTKKKSLAKKERNKYYPVSFAAIEGLTNTGSICGFPIFHSHLDELVYVLTVKDDTPKTVTNKFKKKYGAVINDFFDRILLEHSLKTIKKDVTAKA